MADVKAVFFDVGSTLIYPSPSVGEMFKLVASNRGHVFDAKLVDQYMSELDVYYDREYERNGDFWCSHEASVDVWKNMYKIMCNRMNMDFDSQAISDEMYDKYLSASSWALYDDVLSALQKLKSLGVRMGIISNWDASLPHLIDGLGLTEYFDVVVPSAARGCRKPHRRIFECAISEMGVDAAYAVHVGDLPEADGAAMHAGIRPVIIDRRGRHCNCAYDRIDSLEKLGDLLGLG